MAFAVVGASALAFTFMLDCSGGCDPGMMSTSTSLSMAATSCMLTVAGSDASFSIAIPDVDGGTVEGGMCAAYSGTAYTAGYHTTCMSAELDATFVCSRTCSVGNAAIIPGTLQVSASGPDGIRVRGFLGNPPVGSSVPASLTCAGGLVTDAAMQSGLQCAL